MFATQDLKMGELITSERAIIIVPHAMRTHMQAPLHFTEEEIRQAMSFEREKELKLCFDRVSEESQKAYLSLKNSRRHHENGPIEGILRTNGLNLGSMNDPGFPNGKGGYIGVFRDISRINHRFASVENPCRIRSSLRL